MLLLSLAELAVKTGWVSANLLPAPSDVVQTLVVMGPQELLRHMLASTGRVASGFALGAGLGLLLGAVVGLSRRSEDLLNPTFQALRAIPSLAWVPLLLLWLGIDEASKVVLIAIGAFFPVYMGVSSGFRDVDRKLVEVGQMYGLGPVAMVRRVLLPAALPPILTGLRNGLSLSWMFMVAAELIAATQGLGYLLTDGRETGRADIVLAAIFFTCTAGPAERHRDAAARTTAASLARHAGHARHLTRYLSPTMTDLLNIRIRSKHYGQHRVLGRVDIALQAAEVVSLVGASGCGKSTLLRVVAGLERDFVGDIQLNGHVLNDRSPDIGYIFQEPRLFPWLGVAENIAFGADPRKPEPERVTELLNEVGLDGLAQSLPKQLSGGQAQRAAIARGLYNRPRLLLMDEPFSAVDAFTRMKLQDLLTRIVQHHGITVLLVTHDIEEAVYLSDRVLVLEADSGTVRTEVAVPHNRPRQRADNDLTATRAQILENLHAVHAL